MSGGCVACVVKHCVLLRGYYRCSLVIPRNTTLEGYISMTGIH